MVFAEPHLFRVSESNRYGDLIACHHVNISACIQGVASVFRISRTIAKRVGQGGMRPRSFVALPARPVLDQLAITLRAACRLFTSTPPAGAHCTACKTRTDVPEGYKTNAVAA